MERPRAKPDSSTQGKLRKEAASEKDRSASKKKKRDKIKGKRSKDDRSLHTRASPTDVSPRHDVTSLVALQPIEFYLNDGAFAVREMFRCLSAQQLADLIPPGLKGVPMDELLRLCTVELKSMPRELSISILHGQLMPPSPPQCQPTGDGTTDRTGVAWEPAWLEAGSLEAHAADSTSGVVEESLSVVTGRLAASNVFASNPNCGALEDSSRPLPLSTEPSVNHAEQRSTAIAIVPPPSFVCQSQLEIIELEARARAIKAMLSKVTAASATTAAASLCHHQTGNRKSPSSGDDDDKIEDNEEAF